MRQPAGGLFSAYRHLAARDDLHAIIHLGDYLYEYAPASTATAAPTSTSARTTRPPRWCSLADYRQRHAQYKPDPDLQALHARHPFIVTWDDHEVTNDPWRDGAENHQPAEGDYAARRAARPPGVRRVDAGAHGRHRRHSATAPGSSAACSFGALAEISMLDLRTYRDQQVDDPAPTLPTPRPTTPDGTITGREQLDWLKQPLRRDRPQWKLVGNPVMIAPVTFAQLPHDLVDPVNDVTGLLPRDGAPYNVDQWDGYTDDRRELFDAHPRPAASATSCS